MMRSAPLSAFDRLLGGDWWAVLDPYMMLGDLAFAIVAVAIMIALYMNSRSLAIPAVVAMLAGGVVASYAPAPVQRGAFGVIFLGVTLFGWWLWTNRQPQY